MNNFLERTIAHFGAYKQMVVCIEEMAELTQQLSKHIIDHPKKSFENAVEEIADVEIMLAQMKIIFHVKEDVLEKIKQAKYKRLSEIYNIPLQEDG